MRAPALLLILVLVGQAGCKPIGKDRSPTKPASRTRDNPDTNSDDPWWRKNGDAPEAFGPKGGGDPDTDRPTSRAQADALLAGRVVDDTERPVADAFIQISYVGEEGKKPVGVNTDRQGLFVVEGLKPGRSYELSARVEDGKRVLGQTVVVRAPNARVFLRVSEAGVTSLTPPPQKHVGEEGPFAAPPPKTKPKGEAPPSAVPGPDPVGGDPLAPEKPSDYSPSGNSSKGTANPPPPPVKKQTNADPSLIGGTDDPKRPVPANIPPPNPVPSNYQAPRPSPPPPRPAPPKPVTSTDTSLSSESDSPLFEIKLRGMQRDSDWQFSTASGRLVLLDFWSTTCQPCLRALPETNALARTYASSGLEVVGIACEAPDSFEQQAMAVQTVSRRYELKYGVYLDGEKNQAQKLFKVNVVPTMVLLDRKGKVLWRGTGARRENFEQLEDAIKNGLARK